MSARRRRRKQAVPIEIIGIMLIFVSILAAGQFGIIGRGAANILRLFVGESFLVLAGLMTVMGGYYLLNGSYFKFKSPRWLGALFIYLAVLIGMHFKLFEPLMNSHINIPKATWRFFIREFKGISQDQSLGGGMIGAGLYALSYLLFENVGTFLLMGLLIFFGVMSLGQFSYQKFFQTSGRLLKQLGHVIWSYLRKLFESVKKNSELPDVKKSKDKRGKHSNRDKKAVEKAKPEADAATQTSENSTPPQIIGGHVSTSDENENVADTEPEESVEELSLDYGEDLEDEQDDYELPTVDLLAPVKKVDQSEEYSIIEKNIKVLEETFDSFGVDAKVVKANLGPAVTKYEIQPAIGVKVSRIVNLTDDLALALAAKDIRMEAPIPGKSVIGIEVPNSAIGTVFFKDVMSDVSPESQKKLLEVPLGRDISGHVAMADLSKMPHLLVAGATGSGKSVAINSMIASILMKAKPHQVRLMLIDPKKVELNVYDDIPHLLTPVVTNPKKAARALQNVVSQMEDRYELFSMTGTRNLESYNQYLMEKRAAGEDTPPLLPYIVVIVDELSDLMMVASKEVEDAIIRLAQMARAAGIHMVLATQRPSVDVITGLIKANVPSRMAFAVSSGTDSRTILDANGAEKLLGRGDMLFEPMGSNKPNRIQGAFISDDDVERITQFIKEQRGANYVEQMIPTDEPKVDPAEEKDEYFDEAIELIREMNTASISLLQRRFRIGYNRAARLMDDLEAHGVVGPQEGPKPREVLVEPSNQEETAEETLHDKD